jgi:hypothetical protein
MTTKLPTKAQVVAVLAGALVEEGNIPAYAAKSAERLASALVRAGLAEEPREEGWYWVKWDGGDMWTPRYMRPGSGPYGDWGKGPLIPEIIAARIHPPKE